MTVEGAVSDTLFPPVAISARTSMLVVALCWMRSSEGYDVGVLGAILLALVTDAS